MPKLKTHKGAAKRFRMTGTGKIKRGHSFARHILTKKSSKRKRQLDIDVIPRARWWANNGAERETLAKVNPYKDGCPPEILQRQAEQYARIFQIFNKYSDQILRVTFWNLHDGQSWLNYFPWDRVNHPLLFDRAGKPKPAYEAVLRELKKTVAADVPRLTTELEHESFSKPS